MSGLEYSSTFDLEALVQARLFVSVVSAQKFFLNGGVPTKGSMKIVYKASFW